MPILYKFITTILAFTGCISLVITGEINPVMAFSGLAAVPGYYRFLKGRPHAPSWAIGMFSVLTLIVFLFDSIVSGDLFLAVAHLTITFQAIKSFDLKEPWDHIQVYFMSLLQLIIASELTYSFAFGVVFVLFMITLVTAMVLSHFIKEGQIGIVSIKKPVFMISVLTIVITSLFFIALPRTVYKFLGKSHTKGIKTAGFSERVDFGSFGTVKLDPTVIMRIEMGMAIDVPLYWRGQSLDYFDGMAWKSSVSERARITRVDDEFTFSPYDRSSAIEQKIYLEPIDSDIVFGLADIKGLKADTFSVVKDSEKGIYFPRKASRRTQYTVYSIIGDDYPGTGHRRYLQLPSGMERIINLAGSVTSTGGTEHHKALLIEQYLKSNYTYSLSTTPPPKGKSPIEDFIFGSKKGYCEHYATSMAIMLRGVGIQSRVVTGFIGGEKNMYGGYLIVRQSDAHSWVEALIDGKWRRFDPTPAAPVNHQPVIALFLDSVRMAWTQYVIGFSYVEQKKIIKTLSMPFTGPVLIKFTPAHFRTAIYAFLAAGIFLCGLYLLVRYKRHEKYGFVTSQYMVLKRNLKNKGLTISPSTTAGHIRKEAMRLNAGADIDEFIMLYETYRFGKKEMDSEGRNKYSMLLKGIKRML
jgi:transglutaminase-like putative cysteine protease